MSGIRLHAEVSGPSTAPVVVMGCSLGSTSRMWEPIAARVAETHRVVVLDTRGHGRSPVPPGPYTIDDLGSDVLLTLEQLGVAEFSYAGISLGGQVGIWLGSQAPDRLQRLSLWCTGPVLATPQSWRDRAATVLERGTDAVADAVVARWFTSAFAERNPADVAGWRNEIAATPAVGYAGCCEALAVADLTERLGRIAAPTLVVAASEDPVAPPAMMTAMAEQLPSSRFALMSPASHLAPIERPAAAAELLLTHLGSRGRGDG